MKYLPTIAGAVLGLLFVAFSVPFLIGMTMEGPTPHPDVITVMTVYMSTGYMKFIKVFELLGGILVAIPKTRNLGLLVLGPIIINIIAFNIFMNKWANVFDPMMFVIYLIPLYLLWVERKSWKALIS